MRSHLLAALLLVALPLSAFGQVVIPLQPGAAGSDGPFTFVGDAGTPNTMTIDLGAAAVGLWDAPSSMMGKGIYDSSQWVVVYKYSTINITSTQTVKFKNHPKGAPVVWLATGNVTIDGNVSLDGENGGDGNAPAVYAAGGPGGFAGGIRGGNGSPGGSAGFGPGGGGLNNGGCCDNGGAGGGYANDGPSSGGGATAGKSYGSPLLLPLIGGSGGGGSNYNNTGGGGGGGAILIATTGNMVLNGTIQANGGQAASTFGHGSGGGIRLVVNDLSGTGALRAWSGYPNNLYGRGFIRVETTSGNVPSSIVGTPPPISVGLPGQLFPALNATNAPQLRVKIIAGMNPSADPFGNLKWSEDMLISNVTTQATVVIEAKNISVTANTSLQIRIVPSNNVATIVNLPSTALMPDVLPNTYTASTNVTFQPGRSVIQLRLLQ